MEFVGKVYNCGKNLSPLPWTWGSTSKSSSFGSISDVVGGAAATGFGHSSTVERLYAWEKKLFEEVKVIILPCLNFKIS